ncbi:VTT domain-containing protein [Psychromicrobium xiongbiense]|uniref:VTT domain-containing protein n=1 Tax=Psychromicrobium xiongbiense TaxID=3051184 RepID=UPI002555AF0E|nr:VTT domain-containing protein [Psychromicrobium sp. YIM S02556]
MTSLATSLASIPSAVAPVFTGGAARASLLPDWLNPSKILDNPALGFWVVVIACAIIFAETGLLLGFFLPGDSLLFTAGLLSASGKLPVNIWVLALLLVICAIVGNQVGYLIGQKAGPALFKRPDSRFFKQENLAKAHAFFEKHGGKALILARFVPIVRTFVPVIVGVAQYDRKNFLLFNVAGGVLWAGGVTLLGGLLGESVPWVKDNLDLIFIVIVVLSLIPIVVEVLRSRKKTS